MNRTCMGRPSGETGAARMSVSYNGRRVVAKTKSGNPAPMRLLFAIPHYVRSTGDATYGTRSHGSLDCGAGPRIEALTDCLTALHGLFRPAHGIIDHCRRSGRVVP